MAKIYKAITSATTTTLIAKDTTLLPNNNGRIKKITISNNSSNPATGICVDLYDGTNVYYLIRDTAIPSGVTLVLDDNVSFNAYEYNLRISNAGTNPDITVIIK